MKESYDGIGRGYTVTRRPDPRIARQINDALGDARSLVNVGAGSGSYEPDRIAVVAVEPSLEMIRQRPSGAAPAVRARAEALPFADNSFDAALAILTIHHWNDLPAGLAEMRRVARRRVVILTWDLECHDLFWLPTHYVPELTDLDRGRIPALAALAGCLGDLEVLKVPVPRDCQDGFQGAFWAKPEAYLDPGVRRAMSSFALLPAEKVERGLNRLADDLRSGRWDEQFGRLRTMDSIDLGYRLVIAQARD